MPGNPLVRFDEGRGGRTHSVALSPTLPRDAVEKYYWLATEGSAGTISG